MTPHPLIESIGTRDAPLLAAQEPSEAAGEIEKCAEGLDEVIDLAKGLVGVCDVYLRSRDGMARALAVAVKALVNGFKEMRGK